MSKNKFFILGLLCVSLFVLILSASYAIWQIALQQETTNIVNTACFKINFKDQNEINLQSTYPISDEEGMNLTPYTFTIENICNTTAFYQVNLEELNSELKKLSNEYVKVSLNNNNGKLLNTYTEVDKTIENASISHRLTSGSLKEKESKTFELRLWLDENTPATSDVMNATFQSKITIIAIQKEDLENDFTEENKSLNEDFSNKEETVEFKARSKDYNIIEKSEDNIIYNPLDEPSKEVAISKTYTIDGTYSMYFKDEVGNIIESTAETTKLDQVDPIVNFTASEYQDGIKVDASSSSDEKSGIKNYYYKLNENDYIESTSSSHTFTGLSDGDYKVTMKVEDRAGNFSEEKELDVTLAYERVYISSSGSDSTGNGSGAKPYATLQRAYNKVKNGGEMILLSNITATSTTIMNTKDKMVTLKSNGSSVYSINRNSSFLSHMLVVENANTLTTTNVILDGKSINANGSLIEARNSTLNLNSGTTIQNNIHVGNYNQDWKATMALGGGVYMYGGTINMNGATINNNIANYSTSSQSQGGGIAIYYGTLNLNNGTISNNVSWNVGGGVMAGPATVNMKGGLISNNQAVHGGGIALNSYGADCIMTMTGGTISNNKANIAGGGVSVGKSSEYNYASIFYFKEGTISNNTAPTGPNTYTTGGGQLLN